MLEITIAMVFLAAFYFLLAYLNSFVYIKFAGFILGMFQLMMLFFAVTGNYLTSDISNLLRINAWVVTISLGVLILLSFVLLVLHMTNLSSEEGEIDAKWVGGTYGKK